MMGRVPPSGLAYGRQRSLDVADALDFIAKYDIL
jgi:hypothetical protein